MGIFARLLQHISMCSPELGVGPFTPVSILATFPLKDRNQEKMVSLDRNRWHVQERFAPVSVICRTSPIKAVI